MLIAPRRKPSGFTLIEMAITLAIFGFMMAAAMPSIGVWLDNSRIRNVTESLQSGLQTARAEAIRRNQNITFWLVDSENPAVLSDTCNLSSTSGSWVVSVTSPVGSCSSAPSTTVAPMIVQAKPVGDAGGNVSVTATGGTSVTFNGFGRIANIGTATNQIDVTGTVTGTTYRPMRLLISTSGMVQVCDPGVTDSHDPRICPVTP